MNRGTKARPARRYLFGSSNICNVYDNNCTVHTGYNLKRATNLRMLESELSRFRENGAAIIISMVEKAIEDGLRQANNELEALEYGKNAIAKFFAIIEQESVKFPDSRIITVKPTLRPAVRFYNQFMNNWESFFEGQSTRLVMAKDQVTCIETLEKSWQKFGKDNVHFTPAAGRLYLDTMLMTSDHLLTEMEAEAKIKAEPMIQDEEMLLDLVGMTLKLGLENLNMLYRSNQKQLDSLFGK